MVHSLLMVLCAMRFMQIQAQQKSPKFGKIDIENLKMEVYAPHSSAGAVILSNFGITTLDNAGHISYSRHTRIKIL